VKVTVTSSVSPAASHLPLKGEGFWKRSGTAETEGGAPAPTSPSNSAGFAGRSCCAMRSSRIMLSAGFTTYAGFNGFSELCP